ncbi:MAG: alpha/beta fold hydrolase [Pseudomonadota bacterium]|nr:alpha/beta fold hydrolase [Pseudomonadota bacterium]
MTRYLLALQVGLAAAVFFGLQRIVGVGSNAAVLLAAVLIVLARMAITGNNFRLAHRYRSGTPTPYRIGRRQALRLYLNEFIATMLSSSWTMPFRAFDQRPAKHPVGVPVLLIHGYGCNSGYWQSMSRALQAASVSHHAVSLEPILAPIDDYVPHIAQAVETLMNESACAQIILVCHSMGGLVARAYLRAHGARNIARVITLGTPHQGTGLALHGAGENSRQMQFIGSAEDGQASDWLQTLAHSEDAASRALFVSIYSHHDNIVAPQTSSHLEGATNIALPGIGHVALGSDRQVQALVLAQIRQASRACATTEALIDSDGSSRF